MSKRDNYLSWDEYFMGIAFLSGMRSKDPSTQVGACIIVVHAELNAILNSIKSLKNCTIYVTHFPCNECAKAIVQSGIKKVIYFSDKHKSLDSTKASRRIFENARVETIHLEIKKEAINIQFKD